MGVAGSAKYLQLEQEQLLVTNKSSKFAVSFEFACQPPEGCVVSAVVLCAKEADMQKLGSVRRCKKHVELEGPSGEFYGYRERISQLALFRVKIVWLI